MSADSRLHSLFVSTKNTILRFAPAFHKAPRLHGHVDSSTTPGRPSSSSVTETSTPHPAAAQQHSQTPPDTPAVKHNLLAHAGITHDISPIEEPSYQETLRVQSSTTNNLHLPEDLELQNADITNILNEAHNKRTARSIRRQIAAHRVRLCEDNLKSLREDLQHADKDLEEVDNNIGVLEDLYRQKNAAMVNTTSDVGHATSTTFYDSGASDDSASSTSDL